MLYVISHTNTNSLVRSIYFFSALSVSGSAADYVLAVLPTFIYFTSFTLIIAFWATTVKRQLQTDFKQFVLYIRYLVIIINAILYGCFLIIVLVHHFLAKPPDLQCGGRAGGITTKTSSRTEQGVTIAYAVIIAVISFIISVAFIYFGGRMNYHLTRSTKASSTKRKVILITVAFSTFFLLHCIFILVLAGLSKANNIFSFIGLFITEICPSIFFMGLSNRLSRTRGSSGGSSESKYQTRSGGNNSSHVDISMSKSAIEMQASSEA
jgi:hypothetical protein